MAALTRTLARALRRLRPAAPAPFEAPPRRRDPSPSKWRYRLDRLGRRASVRFALRRLAAPLLLGALAVWAAGAPALRERAADWAEQARAAVMDRPEFAVTRLSMQGGSPDLRDRVARRIALDGPVSSLRLDLRAIREAVETTPGVASARVAVLGEGVLQVVLAQRAPAALWRWEGQLHLVDADGVVIAPVARRADRPTLPLMVGEGADRAAPEAIALWGRAQPLSDRVRALVRVGERRWNLVLVSDQTVMLPAQGAEAALARLLALNARHDLLEREVRAVDLRDSERPTLRLTPRGAEHLERLRTPAKGKDA